MTAVIATTVINATRNTMTGLGDEIIDLNLALAADSLYITKIWN
jgi:hypothetical protein